MDTLEFTVNQQHFSISSGENFQEKNLMGFLRENGFTGCKQVCGEGGCGACTVLLSQWDDTKKRVSHSSVATCLTPLATVHRKAITTVEGMGQLAPKGIHPISEVFYKMGASQCGFCSPGFIINLFCRLEQNRILKKVELENIFDGNLCRCTGYRPILDAAAVFCVDNDPAEAPQLDPDKYRESLKKCQTLTEVFPESFKTPMKMQSFFGEESQWLQPVTSNEVIKELKGLVEDTSEKSGHSKIVAGNTDIAYEERKKPKHYKKRISLSRVEDIQKIVWESDSVKIGAGVTVDQLQKEINHLDEGPKKSNSSIQALLKQCRYFANNQVRQMATVGGGLVNLSCYSDLIPVWIAVNAKLTVLGSSGISEKKLGDFLNKKGALDFKLAKDEILMSFEVPLARDNQLVSAYKYARRRMDSITFLSAGFSVDYCKDTKQIKSAIICYDGLGQPGQRMLNLESSLVGKELNNELVLTSLNELEVGFKSLICNRLPEKLQKYQLRLAKGALTRFLAEIEQTLKLEDHLGFQELTSRYPQVAHRTHLKFDENNVGVLGKAIPHINAKNQTTGAAKYSTDIEAYNCLYAHLITSPTARGKIKTLDGSKVLEHPSVKAFFTAKDIPGKNLFGFRVEDEQVLASEEVHYVGQPIGVIVGTNENTLKELASLVKIEIEEIEPLLMWDQAINANSFHGRSEGYLVKQGNLEKGFNESDKIVEGEIEIPGQSHFYLEPHSSMVIPQDEILKVYSATQSPSNVVDHVSRLLNIKNNQVEVKVGRLGGGFGGKQLRAGPIAAICALASFKMKQPVKLVLDRSQDLAYCPGRSPIKANYKVGFSESGQLKSVDIKFYLNGGHSSDYSADVAETATLLMDSCYSIENVRVHGHCLKMNYGSYTATRGFGKPQASGIIESIIDHGASELGLDPTLIRERNLYGEGDYTITKARIGDNVMKDCWNRLLSKSDYKKLKREVDEFNQENHWLKRGIACISSKGNMGFLQSDDINRGIALIHLMRDGTVSVNHSGCEMGQGINTRMAQVTAHHLGVPLDKVVITDTQSALIPNTPPTTMVATDLIGKAIIKACNKLKLSLNQYSGTFQEQVEKAYIEGLSLSETGIYTLPRLAYDYEKQEGDISYFFVWGAALSIAEVDLISGNFRIIKSNVVQDCGKSLNPHLDIGQAEGGFLFGLGYYTLEEMIYDEKGRLITDNVSGYKIPSCGDVPLDWDVELLNYAPKDDSLHSSKGIGEANTQLGLSAYFAIKEAVRNSRKEHLMPTVFQMGFPSSVDRVCQQLPAIEDLIQSRK